MSSITTNDLFFIVYIFCVNTVAVFFNVYICCAIYTEKSVLLIYRIIGQQCLSDLMFAVASLLSFIICAEVSVEHNPYFRWTCFANSILFSVSLHVSCVCVTLSAMERVLQSNTASFCVKLRNFLNNHLLIMIWLPSLVSGVYHVLLANTMQVYFGREVFTYCLKPIEQFNWVTSHIRSSFLLFAVTTTTGGLFPFLSVAVCYPVIFVRLRKADNLSESQREDCRNVIKMLVAINLALIVLRTPFGITGFMDVHHYEHKCLDPRQGFGLNNITYYLFVLHTVVNAIILCYYNRKLLVRLTETMRRLLPSNDASASVFIT